MSEQPEHIQIEPNEDVPSVRDRLSMIRGRRVLLIWPESSSALTRKLDLVLIQREAKRRVLQLALVTHDRRVMQHANELNISTFETIQASQRKRWKRGRSRVFVQRHHKPEDAPDPQDLMPHASRVRRPRKRLSLLRYALSRTAMLLMLLGVLGAVAFVMLPEATVTLPLARQTLRVDLDIVTDPQALDVNVEAAIIPATRLRATVETASSLATTGSVRTDDLPASGTVTFTNQANRRIEIPQGTVVSTSAGTPILFQTLENISLPAGIGERAQATVEALPSSLGPIGNVPQGQINTVVGPLGQQITVRNLAPMSGGESRSMAAVTEADRNQLQMMVAAQLQRNAYEEMQLNLLESQTIVVPSIRIAEQRNDWTQYSHNVGDISDALSLSMRAIIEAIAIDDAFARQIVFARLSAQRQPGYVLQTETFRYERGTVGTNEAGYTTFRAFGEVQAIGQYDAERLRNTLAAQDPQSAQTIIAQQVLLASGQNARITLTPDWMPLLPVLPMRIKIETE